MKKNINKCLSVILSFVILTTSVIGYHGLVSFADIIKSETQEKIQDNSTDNLNNMDIATPSNINKDYKDLDKATPSNINKKVLSEMPEFIYMSKIDGYEINIYAEKNIFPKDTEVIIKKVDSVNNQNIEEIIEEKLSESEQLSTYVAFDITFYCDGEEIQPEEGKVQVSIKLASDINVEDSTVAKVFHIDDESNAEEISTESFEENTVTYEAREFSVYAVALTEIDYIPIYTAEDLKKIREDTTKNYRLMNDIDLGNTVWEPIYNERQGYAMGSLDGNNYIIKNLNIDSKIKLPNTMGYTAGFFGYLQMSSVKNLVFENAYITVNTTDSDSVTTKIGILAGQIENTHIDNIQIKNSEISISTNDKYIECGGIVGGAWVGSSKISNSSFDGSISIDASMNGVCCGGIAGGMRGDIFQCINYGNISVSSSTLVVGGLVGGNDLQTAKMENSSNHGAIEIVGLRDETHVWDDIYVGGLIGEIGGTGQGYNLLEGSTLKDCYNSGNIHCLHYISDKNNMNYNLSGIGGIAGLVGDFTSEIANSYNVGLIQYEYIETDATESVPIENREPCGILVGYIKNSSLDAGVTLRNCYYIQSDLPVEVNSNKIQKENVDALTEEEMKNHDSFVEFDFGNIWKMGEDTYFYPMLQCENKSFDYNIVENNIQIIYPQNKASFVPFETNTGGTLYIRFKTTEEIIGYNIKKGTIKLYDYDTDELVYEAKDNQFTPGVCSEITVDSKLSESIFTWDLKWVNKSLFMSGKKYYIIIDNDFLEFSDKDYHIGVNNKNEWFFSIGTKISTTPKIADDNIGTDTFYNIDFEYSDSYFTKSSYIYNHNLTLWALSVAMSAFNCIEGKYSKGDRNVENYLVGKLGFHSFESNDGFKQQPTPDTIGVAAANKKIWIDSEQYTIIIVPVRGAGYEKEWASNVTVGSGEIHSGFNLAATQVLDFLKKYIQKKDITGKVKIMVTGYSRAAAVTNLTVAELDKNLRRLGSKISLDHNDIYGFCFEPPATVKIVYDDFGNEKYDNIHNIINPIDIVPMVPLSQWGFRRYGVEYYLPSAGSYSNFGAIYREFLENHKKIVGKDYLDRNFVIEAGFPFAGFVSGGNQVQEQYVRKTIDRLASAVKTNKNYVDTLQQTLYNIMAEEEWENNNISWWRTKGFIKILKTAWEILFTGEDDITTLINNFDLIIQPHYPTTCLAWMTTINGEGDYGSGRYRKVYVNCPVDVQVYDSTNKLVALIENNIPQVIEDSTICSYIDENSQKIFILPCDEEYHIKIIATDAGEVNYSVAEFSLSEGKNIRKVDYSNVIIQKDDELYGVVENINEVKGNYPLKLNENNLSPTEKQEQVRYYDIKVSIDGNGTTYGENTVSRGEFIQLTAIPDDGWKFLGWYENDILVSRDIEYRFQVMSDRNFIAKFTQNSSTETTEYIINASSKEHGSINPSGLVTVTKNVTQTFIITPDKGYIIDQVLVDGNNVGAVSTYEFTNINRNHTITAIFKKKNEIKNNYDSESNSSSDDSNNTTTTYPFLSHLGQVITVGTWKKNSKGWLLLLPDESNYARYQWAYINNEWYLFNKNAYMIVGWANVDGRWYYLNPISDGTQGRMLTGWQLIDGRWYYFNEVSDGTKGAMMINTWIGNYYVNTDGVWEPNKRK